MPDTRSALGVAAVIAAAFVQACAGLPAEDAQRNRLGATLTR